MTVVPADTDDADDLADLWVELAEEQRDHGSHLHAEANREGIRDAMVRHAVVGGLLIARRDDEVVGFVMFEPEGGVYEQDCQRGLVRNLYVVPEYRGEGVGSALLAAAEETLVEQGVEAVALEAMADNDRARTFYRDHGYEPHRVELEKSVGSDRPSNEDG